ncbi:MAG: ATP-dependent zinc metalloprotease FtsH, partial [Anaerolineae bacterium 49_20]
MNSRNQTFVIYLLLFMAIITMLFFNFQQQAAEVRTIPIN